jgi:2,3-bisphosphoglycerate-independent phosphoglycerate mutase
VAYQQKGVVTVSDYPGLIETLAIPTDTKIVFFILDGVGGLHVGDGTATELQTANTPNLDQLAKRSSCGHLVPITPGVTTGSGPGHFALFGYDPVENNVGRGVLESAGIGFELTPRDVAVRGNFATIDADANIVDRRAGRISTEENERVCQRLREEIEIPNVEVFIETVKEHRLLVVFRGDGLSGDIDDTDPQSTGVPALPARGLNPEAEETVKIVNEFVKQVGTILADEKQANMVTLRGFAKHKPYASMKERFALKSLCLANYPMYRGVSFLVGMDLYRVVKSVDEQLDALEKEYDNYDFFFVHAKTPDKTGEDGNFEAKVAAIEELDQVIPRILALKPDVLVVTGDHSTPSALESHSWHPVPVLLASQHARLDLAERLDEVECLKGALGQIPAKQLMGLALAHAGKLKKFGA